MRLAVPSLVRFARQQIVYIVVSVVLGAVFWAIGLPINPWHGFGVHRLHRESPLVWNRSGGVPFFGKAVSIQLADLSADPSRIDGSGLPDFERDCVVRFSAGSADAFSSPSDRAGNFRFWSPSSSGSSRFCTTTTKDRLEQRNQELEQSVKQGAAQLEKQEEEMQRAERDSAVAAAEGDSAACGI